MLAIVLFFREKWNLRKWDGPPQYQDQATKSLMMLLTDMARKCMRCQESPPLLRSLSDGRGRVYTVTQDKAFRPWVEKYAADENLFFNDFSKVFAKLIENGVPTEVSTYIRRARESTSYTLLTLHLCAELQIYADDPEEDRRPIESRLSDQATISSLFLS